MISPTTSSLRVCSIAKSREEELIGTSTDTYWANLTPEQAFFARVFVDHCIAIKDAEKLDASLPVVTALAYHIQAAYNAYQEDLEVAEQERVIRGEPTEEEEEARIDKEFVIGEMLKVAVNLDYADEIGRRKMFQLVRDMISQEALPESLVARCLDVLRMLSPNERDLIRVVVEVVHELRDVGDEEEAVVSRTPLCSYFILMMIFLC